MNRRWMVLGFTIVAGSALAACDGSTPAGTDAGPPATDSGPPAELPVLAYGTLAAPDEGLADYSCLGTLAAPTPGADVTFAPVVEDFQTHAPVADVEVHFFPGNNPNTEDTCASPACQTLTSNATGVAVPAPSAPLGGWYAVRILGRAGASAADTTVRTVQYNEITPAMGAAEVFNSVSQATLNLLPTLFGLDRVGGTGLISGQVRDCAGHVIHGAIVRLFDPAGVEIIDPGRGRTRTKFAYFNGSNLPSASQDYTNWDGLYAAANVVLPATPDEFRAEIWGRTTAGGPMVIIGCEELLLFPDTVTIMNIGPLRSDGPAACGTVPAP